ncbi:hypothetical protein POM88_045775 [Heracleum sosnowskyi]|uniref:Uncharacterized protein n=1 Tax=Heracleum sosnowskyi TaxID=360622 RepID=A0AAD8H7I3_9APIA|nr:hypothetical protein POM88_045775 [Heracleum sosnowskyi]
MPTANVGSKLEDSRLFDAVNVLLSLQSRNGGASCMGVKLAEYDAIAYCTTSLQQDSRRNNGERCEDKENMTPLHTVPLACSKIQEETMEKDVKIKSWQEECQLGICRMPAGNLSLQHNLSNMANNGNLLDPQNGWSFSTL